MISIFQSKEIWLSNSRKMNDYHETTWIEQFIDNKLNEIDPKKYGEFIRLFVQNYKLNASVPYIACFSEDGDVLSQWRAYSEDGSGVAIGFDIEKLGIENKLPITGATSQISTGFSKVIYDIEAQKNIVNQIFDHWLDKINLGTTDTTASIEVMGQLKMYASIFKNPSFKEEKECRLIHTPLILDNNENETTLMGQMSDVYFRENKRDIVSYFKWSFEKEFSSSIIPKIIVGPKCRLEKYDFNMYLSVNGLQKTEVSPSSSSYR